MRQVLVMRDISKRFPGVVALDNINLELNKGEVLGLVGENGAGKSTLIKILDGIYQMDSGEIWVEGEKVRIRSPFDAYKIGIRVIHQEVNAFNTLSVAENIFAGEIPNNNLIKTISWRALNKKAKEILVGLKIDIDPGTIMEDLSTAQKQFVEIAKAIWKKCKIIVMDEPTSSLSEKDVKTLFELIEKLKKEGISIIYISHRLDEVFEITDRVMVLRDGKKVGVLKTKKASRDELISLMIGRKIRDMFPKIKIELKDIVFEVEDFNKEGIFYDINFNVREGEIIGIFGLLGCGKDEIVKSIFGYELRDKGKVKINGKEVKIKNPLDALRNNIGYVPIDRKDEGLALNLSVSTNITMANVDNLGKGVFIDREYEVGTSKKWIKSLNIKTTGLNSIVNNLSGGNQQKIVLSKWLETGSKVIIMNEPTRGIDVGAKIEMYRIIEDLCKKGKSVIILSSDLPEIIALSDRIIVISKGKITAELRSEEISQEELMNAANL